MGFIVCVCLRATKSPLKVQNCVPEADSPIKKVAKRSRHVLDSDDDDVPAVKEEVTKQADKEVKREKVTASMGVGGPGSVCETQPNTQGEGGVPTLSRPLSEQEKAPSLGSSTFPVVF